MRMLSRKADVQVFFPNAAYPARLRPRSRIYDRLDPSYRPPDVTASYYDYPALPLISRPINGWMAARTLLPHVREFAPDIVHSSFLYPEGFAALALGKTLSLPVTTKSIGSDLNNIGDRISAMHTRRVLRQADFLFTVSGDLRKKAISMGARPDKCRTLINGCDLSVFGVRDRLEAKQKLNIDPASEAVIYIGRTDVKKGLRELVDAAAALYPHRPRLHVYLVGEGPDRSVIANAIRANNANGYIHLKPACAPGEVPLWMAAAELVTLPSYMEGCPNVVLEALACGRPVVASHVGGISEILNEDCGCLVPPRDPAALAQALASVLDRTWDAQTISARRSRSWAEVAEEMLEVFESLLSTYKPAKRAS